MKLTIISHTEHYYLKDGTLVGWGPTVTEINHLLTLFDEITHVAMLHDTEAPPSALPYKSSKIKFIPLPLLGGRSWKEKARWLYKAPKVISIVRKAIQDDSDCFQLRTPTGMGVYLIPYLSLYCKTPGWYKYAGNWNQHKPPLGYWLQRHMLKIQKRPVTINGSWPHQPKHCLTFENPCVTEQDLMEGEQVTKKRKKLQKWNFVFVGRLETEKGVGRIIQAFSELNDKEKQGIGELHLIGDSSEREYFEAQARKSGVTIKFHGFLPRKEVFNIYKQCDVFIMPTQASEGFPKVIAEAMNFGCIPMVSDVSSISQYIRDGQEGFLIHGGTTRETVRKLRKVLVLKSAEYQEYLQRGRWLVQLFGFKNYLRNIKTEILPKILSNKE